MDYDDDEWDNYSVGSLAVTDAETGGGGVGGRKNAGRGDGEEDDEENDPRTPQGMAKQRGKMINLTKGFFMLLLVGGGTFLAVAAYMLTPKDDGSNSPTVHAAVAGAVFVALILVFLRYDFLVARRTSLTVDMAVRARYVCALVQWDVVQHSIIKMEYAPLPLLTSVADWLMHLIYAGISSTSSSHPKSETASWRGA